MKAYKHLIKFALKAGNTVSVWDGEVWEVKRSTGYQAIVAAIESVEEAEIVIRDSNDQKIGWALISAFGLEDDETVIDNTITPFMELWDAAYNSETVFIIYSN
jgi:hypothetical protein